jgi:hypothetical protein
MGGWTDMEYRFFILKTSRHTTKFERSHLNAKPPDSEPWAVVLVGFDARPLATAPNQRGLGFCFTDSEMVATKRVS